MSNEIDLPSPRPAFDTYDQAVADAMVSSMPLAGIPEYLDLRVTDVGPGAMTAELEVRPELLNPADARVGFYDVSTHHSLMSRHITDVSERGLEPLRPCGH